MDAKKIGARIKQVRLERGITQADLSQMADLTTKYMSNIECGFKLPKLETFIRIANVLETDANSLLADVLESPKALNANLADRLSLLPQEEQRRLLRMFEIMINDAISHTTNR